MKKMKQSKELTMAEDRYLKALGEFEKADTLREKCIEKLQRTNRAYIKAYNRSPLLSEA